MTVFDDPLMVTVLVPFVKTLPVPLVSQLPSTVIEPLVIVIVPFTPPTTETFMNVIEAVEPASVPTLDTLRFEPPVMLNPEVVRVPETSVVLLASIALACVIVPETVRL